MGKQSPLDIPEILSLIASFVPLWEGSFADIHFIFLRLKFKPRQLISCALVSKSWRRAALPRLWAVYSARHMMRIPTEVLAQNSPYFRHFYQNRISPVPQSLWPVLRCTALRSFVLVSTSLPEQAELLRTNRDLVTLEWYFVSTLPKTIQGVIQPFATFLKELRISSLSFDVQELFSLLQRYPGLERLNMDFPRGPPTMDNTDVLSGSDNTKIQTLKSLIVHGDFQSQNNIDSFLSIFRYCPQIEHVDITVRNRVRDDNLGDETILMPLSTIHETVLAWKSQQQEAITLLPAVKAVAYAQAATSLTPSPHATSQGLERLDIRMQGNPWHVTRCHAQFQRGGRDLVAITAFVRGSDLQVVHPLLHSFKNTLRQLDLNCGSIMREYSSFKILGLILGSMSVLRQLKFFAVDGLNREESLKVFRGDFPQEDQGDGSLRATVLPMCEVIGWACQHLERLDIRGLREARFKDPPGAGRYGVTLEAFSKKHQWIAWGETKFGWQLRTIISDRMKTLSSLHELRLESVYFEYVEKQNRAS